MIIGKKRKVRPEFLGQLVIYALKRCFLFLKSLASSISTAS